MVKLQIIGGTPVAGKFANANDVKERAIGPSGEHGKDHFLKMMAITNPVGAHRPQSQPVVYGDYILRIMHTNSGGADYPYIQVIQKNTLNVIRMIKVSNTTAGVDYSGIAIENGKFVLVARIASDQSNGFIVSGSIEVLLQEALKNEGTYVLDIYYMFLTVSLPSFTAPNSGLYSANNIAYDGEGFAYVVSNNNIIKVNIMTGAVSWKKTVADLGNAAGTVNSVQLLDDRVIVTVGTGTAYTMHVVGLNLTNGSILATRVLKDAGVYGYMYKDIGAVGRVGTDIVIKTTLFIARINGITLDTVWLKRFPYTMINIPVRLNLAYNEIPLPFYDTAPSDHTQLQSVKLDLSTGLEKKVLYTIAANDINFIYHLDGDYILGGDSSHLSMVSYMETERIV